MKEHLSVREISYRRNISGRRVSKLARDGRIPGEEMFDWPRAIPEDVEKPADSRKKQRFDRT